MRTLLHFISNDFATIEVEERIESAASGKPRRRKDEMGTPPPWCCETVKL